MTDMLKTLGLIVVGALVAVLLFAATRPDSFRVERSITVQAPPDKVFALINDFRRWPEWSPWEKLDPQMKRTFGGAASGPGAVYAWEGNDEVGAGRMEILEAQPGAKVSIKLDFLRPFEGHNTADFTLQAAGTATGVRWAMHGPSPFVTKLMGVFVDMDRMIGKDFEAGLAQLKAVAEK